LNRKSPPLGYQVHATIIDLTLSPREQLAAYVDRQSQRLASATIRRHIASIGSVLRMSSHPDITKATPVVLSLKRMHRKKGRGPGPAGTR
jgi:hypothetical protein